MIKSISVTNYKAFKEATIDIKPLTVLLGANSVGKSSILQLFFLLKQTATFGSALDKCPFKMYGPFVNMGTVDNLFYKKKENLPLEVSITFCNKKMRSFLEDQLKEFIQVMTTIPYILPIKGLMELQKKKEPKGRYEFFQYIKSIYSILGKHDVEKYRGAFSYLISGNTSIVSEDVSSLSIDAMMNAYDYLSLLKSSQKAGDVDYTFKYVFGQKNKKLTIKSISLKAAFEESSICLFEFDSRDGFTISADKTAKFNFTDLDFQAVEGAFVKNACIFDCFQEKKSSGASSTIANYMVGIAKAALSYLKQEFNPNRIYHVKPLRANPQRYYVIDDEKLTPYVPSLDGDRVIEILRDKEDIYKNVNGWLARYGLALKIEQSEDVIHHIKIIQNGLELDIPDVGFGISQLLPILVQSKVSEKGSITIIEQPEIHLHPIMQADVADMFRAVASDTKPFIIETHSEYLLRRIRRRVATKELSAEDVAIYLFKGSSPEQDSTVVSRLDMTATGAFEWPSDFYGGELYNDIVDFISAQA